MNEKCAKSVRKVCEKSAKYTFRTLFIRFSFSFPFKLVWVFHFFQILYWCCSACYSNCYFSNLVKFYVAVTITVSVAVTVTVTVTVTVNVTVTVTVTVAVTVTVTVTVTVPDTISCYRGLTHRGGKSGCKMVTEFDSYSDDGVSTVIGVQHIEVPNLGASW